MTHPAIKQGGDHGRNAAGLSGHNPSGNQKRKRAGEIGQASPARFRLRPFQPSEWQHQISLVDCLRKYAHPQCLRFSVPNQQDSGPKRGFFLKLLGARAGASDLVFLFRRQILFLELKRERGIQSDVQRAFETLVKTAGGEYAISYSLEASCDLLFARGILTRDLNNPG